VEIVTRRDSQFTIQGLGDGFVTEVIQCLSENAQPRAEAVYHERISRI
jgi:hypothetical protein